MKNSKILRFSSVLFLTVGCLTASVLGAIKSNSDANTTSVNAGSVSSYYSDIDDNFTGQTLLKSLNKLNNEKLKRRVGYGSMPSKFSYTDYDPNNRSKVISFYSGTSATYANNMNREHTWPASRTVGGRGSDPLEDDIHMVRPTLTTENGKRGNSFFVENSLGGGWDPNTFKVDSYRGDAARIIFYCAISDTRLTIVDKTTDSTSNNTMGKLSDLLKWNLVYPVLEREQNRNEGAETLQGNRNPFIDHPEYACRIWGDTNATTKDICSKYGNTAPTKLEITPNQSTIAVNEEIKLSVKATGGSASCTWATSNSAIATVNNGVVKGLKNGIVTITAVSKFDVSIKATATINVKTVSSLAVSGSPIIKNYSAGYEFDTTGLVVKATYDDGTTETVTSKVVWSPNPLTVGTTSVTGTYAGKSITVNGISVSAKYTATITRSNCGIGTASGLTEAKIVTYPLTPSGSLKLKWGIGSFENEKYNTEFGLTKSTGVLEPGDDSFVTSITLDMYLSQSVTVTADGKVVTGIDLPSGSGKSSTVKKFMINSSNWKIENKNSTYAQNFYSLTFDVNPEGAKPVDIKVTGVVLNVSQMVIKVGETFKLIPTINPSDATNKNVTFTSSDEGVATVDENGVVTGVNTGVTTITVTTSDGGFTATCEFGVMRDGGAKPNKGGCGGSIIASSAIISSLSLLGFALLIKRKKK